MLINHTIKIGLLMLCVATCSSCKKYLDYQPRDYMFESEIFSTPQGVQSALNGIYQSLGSPGQYGQALTYRTMDILGQQYVLQANFGDLMNFTYSNPYVKDTFSIIWSNSYKTILNINNFCANLERPGYAVLPETEKNRMLGEAYAARAMVHFDLMRLFGPVPVNRLGNKAIPYMKSVQFEVQPLLTGTQVIDTLIGELTKAAGLLEGDLTLAGSGLDSRKWGLNYYAVQTLLAKVYLYAGKNAAAWQIVETQLGTTDQRFPWMTSAEAAVADPVFSSESLFGVENRALYDDFRALFSALVPDNQIMAPGLAKYNALFNDLNDYRGQSWFQPGASGNKNFNVLVKYSDAKMTNSPWRFYQPVIRKAELVLIGAEAAPDVSTGYQLLNTLRANRGLPVISNQTTRAQLLADILVEYQREFIGEGQLFFTYKRRNMAMIPDATTGSATVGMNPGRYEVPLPENETNYR